LKVLILAGGLGSRLGEETSLKPKPMLEIGDKPVLWHIMKLYSYYGFNEFIILLGYKGYIIKEYFANYYLHKSDLTVNLCDNTLEYHNNNAEPWKVTLLDTGYSTLTGGRVKRAQELVKNERFLLTYGDGVSNVNIHDLIKFHEEHNKLLTMTAVMPEGRFGALDIREGNLITQFKEKPKGDGGWINGGFFVCEPKVFDYITEGDNSVFEQKPLEKLANEGQLYAYKHEGFWKPMDTLRDKNQLIEMWEKGSAPWKIW
jgi:glucose-1-phosphate cytidylyltransferase